MEDYRAQFIDIYNKNVTRPGADRLLKWLEGTDFFTAPASTKFHGACECGLVMHSINVYNAMMQHFFTEEEDNPETFAVCALLHDVCKANFYKVSTRNVKNDATGQWEKVPFYQVADQLPYGHGEKSVYLIEHFMRLKTDEAIAIRWHMGGFDPRAQNSNMKAEYTGFREFRRPKHREEYIRQRLQWLYCPRSRRSRSTSTLPI